MMAWSKRVPVSSVTLWLHNAQAPELIEYRESLPIMHKRNGLFMHMYRLAAGC